MNQSRDNRFFPRLLWQVIVNIGLICIVAGTALPLFQIAGTSVKVVYSAGAALVVIGRLLGPSVKGGSLRVRRLSHLEVWSGIIFCAGAFFMWYTPERQDWIAFTLAGAVLQIYTSLAIPRAMAKDKEGKEDKTAVKQRKK